MARNLKNVKEEKLFKIKILSRDGDKIYLKFPTEFVKRMISINGFNWLNFKNDVIDMENLSKVIIDALDYNLSGEIANVHTKNDDYIKISID